MGRIALDKNTILEDIKRVQKIVGKKNLTQREYLANDGAVSHVTIMNNFGSFKNALVEVEENKDLQGRASEILVTRDIRRVARKIGKTPNRAEYVAHGNFGKNTVAKIYGSWTNAVTEIF